MEIKVGWKVKSNKWKGVSSLAHVSKSGGDLSPNLWVKSYRDVMVQCLD
jgi:hypothetical protein